MLAYEDDAPVPTLDNRAIEAYKGCKQELCRFMSNILMADMLANNMGYAECVLFLPDGDMTINVGVKCDVECSNSVEQELVRTKIGIFDTFTWQMLCDIKRERNPVKICFEHIEEYRYILNAPKGVPVDHVFKSVVINTREAIVLSNTADNLKNRSCTRNLSEEQIKANKERDFSNTWFAYVYWRMLGLISQEDAFAYNLEKNS